MVVLVRCTDQSVSVALQSKLEHLISEGLITAYLGPDGWVPARTGKPSIPAYLAAAAGKSRCTAFVSCF